jgi:hypothetical protein
MGFKIKMLLIYLSTSVTIPICEETTYQALENAIKIKISNVKVQMGFLLNYINLQGEK